jgi:DNA polymerase III alpha subunit (gram-positive type)
MLLHCLRFSVVLVVCLIAVSSLPAQEAIETPKPREESAPEPTPEPTKSPKRTESSAKTLKSLEEQMRPEEFKAAGLDKLSEDELQHLDAYLQGYRENAKKKANQQAQEQAEVEIKKANEKTEEAQKATEEAKRDAAAVKTKLDQLVSRVDGSIDGIKGHTVIRLEDGSVWKQVNTDDHYRATVTDHPAAMVVHTTFGYKMRIEGMPDFYVDPVVRPQ